MSESMTNEEIGQLLARAQAGDASALPQLREWLDRRPDVWRRLGDLAAHARQGLLALAAGGALVGGGAGAARGRHPGGARVDGAQDGRAGGRAGRRLALAAGARPGAARGADLGAG